MADEITPQWERRTDEELDDITSQLQNLANHAGYQYLIACLLDDRQMQMSQLVYDTDELTMRVRQGKIQMIDDILMYRQALIKAIDVEMMTREVLKDPNVTRPLNDKGL